MSITVNGINNTSQYGNGPQAAVIGSSIPNSSLTLNGPSGITMNSKNGSITLNNPLISNSSINTNQINSLNISSTLNINSGAGIAINSTQIYNPISQIIRILGANVTDTMTLSAANMLSGIIVGAPTIASSPTATYTTASVAQIQAAFPTTATIGDTFELTIVNASLINCNIVLQMGANILFFPAPGGSAMIAQNQNKTFKFIMNNATTFICLGY